MHITNSAHTLIHGKRGRDDEAEIDRRDTPTNTGSLAVGNTNGLQHGAARNVVRLVQRGSIPQQEGLRNQEIVETPSYIGAEALILDHRKGDVIGTTGNTQTAEREATEMEGHHGNGATTNKTGIAGSDYLHHLLEETTFSKEGAFGNIEGWEASESVTMEDNRTPESI